MPADGILTQTVLASGGVNPVQGGLLHCIPEYYDFESVAKWLVEHGITQTPQVVTTGDVTSCAFEQPAADEPAVAKQVLFSAVGALANLQTTRAVKAELKRRVERN